ncbi:T9SS type A sorting domain-containing protein [uncultured Draconibacterium sp.]|uniref:DUF7507 domain-containing protein n=1 Tax=uncultured Draconibacterium sp. TaxID=1573823 RepID=UPI0025CC76CA|nr:T9SS type A sorting domain-containing protein [uncultured Draconibacterium sp.]
MNPSFETGSGIPHNDVAYLESQVGDNPQIDGWYSTHITYNGAEGAIEHWRTGFLSTPSQNGDYHVELNVSQSSRLYQIVFLVNGETIDWEYYHRQRVATATETVQYSIYSEDGSSKLYTIDTHTASSTSAWDHRTGSYTFTGSTGVYQIGFESTTGGGSGNFLDNVNIGLKGLTEFRQSSITINESEAAGFDPHIVVNGEVQSASTITFTVISVDADEGIDYTFPTKTLNVPIGDYGIADSLSLGFSLINDTKGRGDRTIQINLSSASGDLDVRDANGDGLKQTLTIHVIDDDPSPGDVPKAELWLDASDPDADGNPGNNPADNTDVTTWTDKSGNGNDVTTAGIAGSGINPPSYLNNQFNGQAALRFDKGNNEALGKVLASDYIGDFTLFIVLQGQTASPADYDAFFSSWNNPSQTNSFQIDYLASSQNFQVRTNHGNLAFGPFNQELDLFTVRQSGTTLKTLSDGVEQNQQDLGTALGFNAYRIGANRNSKQFYDSKIAEVIVYARALTDCELEQVNDYLGAKYGRDYYDIAANFDHATAFPNDVTGVGAFGSACSGIKQINTATSSILTIDNPSSNDTQGEFLTLAHDAGTLTATGANLPATLSGRTRLAKSWKADRDGDVGTVDMEFDLSGIAGIGTQASDFKLVIDTDGDGNFQTGTVQTIDATAFASNKVEFNAVTLPDNAVFTIVVGATSGPGVNGPNLWLKADNGATNSGANLTGWTDQTGTNTFTVTGTPGFQADAINFNPAVTFNNTDPVTSLPSDRLSGNTDITYVDGFAVYKHTSNNSNFLGSTAPGLAYGAAIFASFGANSSYVSNGTGTFYSNFTSPGLTNSYNVVNMDVSPTTNPFASGRVNGIAQTLSSPGSDYANIVFTPMIGGTNNAGSAGSSGWPHAVGEVTEIVLYPSGLSATEKLKVESYLAIKYGIHLAGNYVNSGGTPIWDATINATYHNDVFGIGKDDGSGLNQGSSNSINTGNGNGTGQSGKCNIQIAGAASLDDGDFLMIGNDGGALSEQTTGLPTSLSGYLRLGRQWKVKRTGDLTNNFIFDLNGLSLGGSASSDFKLIVDVDGDGDFTTGTVTEYSGIYVNNTLTFLALDLPDGSVFTLVTGPGNPDWTFTKETTSTSYSQVNEALIYKLTLSNTGNVDISNIQLDDPGSLNPIIFPNANEDANSDGLLNPGEIWTAVYPHPVTQADLDAGSYTNIATASGSSAAGPPPTLSDTVTVDAIQTPQILLEISADTLVYGAVGEPIAFKLKASNTGNVTLDSVSLDLVLETRSWGVGSMAPGSVDSIEFTYLIKQEDLDRGYIAYGTTIYGTSPSGVRVSYYDEIFLNANQRPSFSIVKTGLAPDFRSLGDIQFEIVSTNTGNVTIGQVALIDSLVNLVKPLPDMAPGDIHTDTITYSLTQADLDAREVINVATIYGRMGNNGLEVTDTDRVVIDGIPRPELELIKTADVSSYEQLGHTITYTFTANNTGNVTLSNVTLDDPLTGTTAKDLGSIAPGKSAKFTADYTITQVDIDAGSLTNIAMLSGTDPASTVVSANDTLTIYANQAPEIVLEKAAIEQNFDAPGDVINYLLELKNPGNVTMTNVHVSDPLAAIDTVLSTPIIPGGHAFLSGSYTVNQSDIDAGYITNVATVTATDPNVTTWSDNATVTVNADQHPSIELTKTADTLSYSAVDDLITYFIEVENTGNVTITDAVVNDPLTGFTTTITTLGPGAIENFTTTHTITQADIDTAYVLNTALVIGDASGTSVEAGDQVKVFALQAPGIELSKSVDSTVFFLAGDIAEYKFEVNNTGNVTLTNIQLDDPRIPYSENIAQLLPGEVWADSVQYALTQSDVDSKVIKNTATVSANTPEGTTVSDSDDAYITIDGVGALEVIKVTDTKQYSAPGDSVKFALGIFNIGNVTLENVVLTDSLTSETWNIGNMDPFSYIIYEVAYEATQADIDNGTIRNVASATGNTTLGDPVTAMDEAISKAVTSSAIEISKKAKTKTYESVGDVINYTITVSNVGNVTLSNVVVTDTLTGLIQPIGTMAPGDIQTINTSYTITQADIDGGVLYNTAIIDATNPKSSSIENQDTEKVTALQSPSVSITKTASDTTYNSVADVITYSITVKNTGNVTLTDVEVVDALIALDQTLVSLAPGDSSVFTGDYAITQTDIDAGEVINAAIATGVSPKKVNVYDIAEETVVAEQNPSLSIAKTADKSSFSVVGEIINYNLRVQNTGNVTLTAVQVEDPLTATSVNLGALAPLDVQDILVSYTVKQSDLDNGYIENEATVYGSVPGLNKVETKDQLTINAIQKPLMKLTKSAVQSNYTTIGNKIDYKLALENTGNVTLSNVQVSDPLTGVNQTFASVAPAEIKTIDASYFITQADLDSGSVTNVANAQATAPDLSTLQSTDSLTVIALQAPSIKIDKTASPQLVENVGDIIKYTFVISNSGNVTLRDVNLTDPRIPVDLDFPVITPGGVWTTSLDYDVTQEDLDGLLIANTAYVSAEGPNSTITDKDHALVAVKDKGAIEVVKTTSDTIYSAPGDRLRYTVEVTNIGNITLADVLVSDSLTNETWTIDTLAPGASQQFLSVYNVVQDDIDRGTVLNQGKATANEATPLGRYVESVDEATSTAARNAAFELNKTATANTYSKVGEVIRYNLEVKNTGNVTLENITVTDPLTGTNQTIATLAPGTSQSVSANYAITQADIDNDSVINTATIDGNEIYNPSGTLSDNDSYTVYAVQNPGIEVVKTADKSTYNTDGEVIDYTLEVSNTGNVTLHDVVLTDTLTGTVQNIGIMAPGDIQTYHGLYSIKQLDMDAGSLYNEAAVTALTPQNASVNDLDSLTLSANQFAAISLNKTSDVSSFDAVGDVITYTIEVSNAGNVTLNDVTIVDPLTGTNINIGSLLPRQTKTETATYTATQSDLDAGLIQNTASVTGIDPKGKNVRANDINTVIALQAPALDFEKTASPTLIVQAGDPITYTFTVTNTGNTTLTDLKLNDSKVPFGKLRVNLIPGETWTETVVYTTTQQDIDGLIIRNVAEVSALTPIGLTIREEDQALVAIYGKGGIEVIKTTSDPLYSQPGDVLNYEIQVTNIGNLTLSNVELTDSLTGQNWDLGTMAPNEVTTFTSSYNVTQADIDSGQVINSAVVSATVPSGRTLESRDEAISTAVRAAGVSISKTAGTSTYSSVGEIITYTIEIENAGNVTLNNVVITDTLTGTTQTFATIAPGGIETIIANYTITQADLDNGSIMNEAEVTAENPIGASIPNSASCVILADQQPAIELTKTADHTDYSMVGDVVNFTIGLQNTGNVRLTNVRVSDPLTGFVHTIDTLAAGESTQYTTSYSIVQKDLDAGTLVNTALVLCISPRKLGLSDLARVTLTAISQPAIEIEKVANRTNYDTAGDLINYSLTVRNTGNVSLNTVQINDPLTGTNKLLPVLAPGAQNVTNTAYFIKQSDIDNGSLTNIASTQASSPDGLQVNDADTVRLSAVLKPFIDVTKTADKTDFNAAGDVITYNISVKNTGNETLNNIQLNDPLTGLSEFIDTLRVAQTLQFSTSYTIVQNDLDYGELLNVATAIGSDPQNKTITDSDSLMTPAVLNPEIFLAKTAVVDCDVINYQLIVTNSGNLTLSNLSLDDPLIGLTQAMNDLAPNESDTIRVQYQVTMTDFDAGLVTNTATVNSLSPQGDVVTASATISTPVHLDRTTETVTSCDYYDWLGKRIYLSGTYVETLTNTIGCDSIATLELTINKSTNSLLEITTCGSYTWTDGNTYDKTGIYTQRSTNAAGCDHLDVLNLVITDEVTTTENVTACNSYTWIDGNTYTQSGTYSFRQATASGCDSICILNLIIEEAYNVTEYRTSCGAYRGPDGNTYTQSGTYVITQTGVGGCDKVTTLHLTVLNEGMTAIDTTVCDSFITGLGRLIYESGTYEEGYSETSLCDCRIQYNVTVLHPVYTHLSEEACESYTWTNGMTYTETGIYSDTLISAMGCDSIVMLDLIINKATYSGLFVAACDSYLAPDGSELTETGNYTVTIFNNAGCDSIITIDLVMLEQDTTVIDTTVCDELVTINGQTITQSGSYYESIQTDANCTGTVLYNVVVSSTSEEVIQMTACESLDWINGETYDESGVYSFTLMSAGGCDSVIILDLTILKATQNTTEVAAVESYTWTDGNTYTESGTYSQLLTNAAGCDSVDILELVIVPNGYCAPTLISPIADTVIYANDTTDTLLINPKEMFDVCENGEIDDLNIYVAGSESLPTWITKTENERTIELELNPTLRDLGCHNFIVEAINQLGTVSDTFAICVDGYNPHCPPYLARPVPNYEIEAEFDTLNIELSLFDDYLFASCEHQNFSCMTVLLEDGRILPEWITLTKTDTAYILNGIASVQDTGCISVVVQVGNAYGIGSDTFNICVTDPGCSPTPVNPIADTTFYVSFTDQSVELSLENGAIFDACIDGYFEAFYIYQADGNEYPLWLTVTPNDTSYIIQCNPTAADTGCVDIVVALTNSFGTATDTFMICSELGVGANETELADFNINMYPNPTKGEVTVDIESPNLGDVEIRVHTINGQEIFREQYLSTDRVNFSLDEHVSGMYLVIIKSNDRTVVKKLILDRK